MTFVLAHGAVGSWDEVVGLLLLVFPLLGGALIALLVGGASGRGTTPSPDDPAATGSPLKIEGTASADAPRVPDSSDEPAQLLPSPSRDAARGGPTKHQEGAR